MEEIVYIRSVFDNMLMNYIINWVIVLTLTLIIEFILIVIFLKISHTYFAAVNILTKGLFLGSVPVFFIKLDALTSMMLVVILSLVSYILLNISLKN